VSLDLALRLTEILLALALVQQGLEHLSVARGLGNGGLHFAIRVGLGLLLLLEPLLAPATGIGSAVICAALLVNALFILDQYQGPYNGGSDLMGLLILFCLSLAHLLPPGWPAEAAFAYLALQAILSYFKAGWVKVRNPDWRSGLALQDVFALSVYPAAETFRGLAAHPRSLWTASWAVILLELLFPLALFSRETLVAALALALAFHLSNAVFLGFNRFVWFWLAAYPSIFWLQDRLIG